MDSIIETIQLIIQNIQYIALAILIITVLFDSLSFIIMDKITFRIGIPIYIKKIPIDFKLTEFIPNKKHTSGNVVFKFIDIDTCIFRKKYSFFSRNRQFLKGVIKFEGDRLKIIGLMPLSTIMIYIILIMMFFLSAATGLNPIIFAAIFCVLSFVFIFFGIHSFRKTSEELLDNLKTNGEI